MKRAPMAAAVAGIVLLGGGGIAWASSDTSGHYRVATATVADVESTMSLSGTVAASTRRDLSFGAAGSISKISVAVGDTVTSGETLATLDPKDLDAAVTRAKADLAKAKAQLETDQASQASTVSAAVASTASTASVPTSTGTATATTASFTITTATPAATSPELTEALATLKQQQEAVAAAQSAATDAIATAKSALEAQAAACAVGDPIPETDAADDSDDTGEAEPEAAPEVSTACTDALAVVQTSQDEVADRQDELQAALTDLGNTLSDAIATLASSGDSSGGQSSGGESSGGEPSGGQSSGGQAKESAPSDGPSTEGQASGGSGGGSGGSTAGSIAGGQAAIDTAEAALTEVELARDSATLTAPFAGTVLDVQADSGDDVGASDVVVVLVGDGGSTVTTTVTVDQVPELEKGQAAHVTPAGADGPVDGTVTEIGMLPTTGDTVTYPVTIDLADDVVAPEGAGATIELVTSTVADAVTVPSSAVSNTGRTTVTILQDGVATRTPVTIGVVGSTRTSITEGVEGGQEVVLADLDAELPSGETTTTGRTGFGGGTGGPPAGGAAGGRPGRG